MLCFNPDPRDSNLNAFARAIIEVETEEIKPFWVPIYAPSLEGEEVVFKPGCIGTGHSYNFWEQKVEKMPTVQDKKWSVGSEYQYYSFLTWLVNSLCNAGWTVEDALNAIVNNLRVSEVSEAGYCDYNNVAELHEDFQKAGIMSEIYDGYRIISCSNDDAGGWIVLS